MLIDKLVDEVKRKKNPCIVGLDPEWDKLPNCYRQLSAHMSKPAVVFQWAMDVIDMICDIVVAVKPQMAFYEIYGAEGYRVFEQVVAYARIKNLFVIDDSKRNDIGNTAKAYAYAHLSQKGTINADFLTVSPFLGMDSIQPFVDTALSEDKGIFMLVKTSNPGSIEIADAKNEKNQRISSWLAYNVNEIGSQSVGSCGYSSIGAVVGATFPEEAGRLRKIMSRSYFLVPGYGAQGGSAEDIVSCFNEDGLGALVSSSRGIIYKYNEMEEYDGSKKMYREIVREQAMKMQQEVYWTLRNHCKEMEY